jgi:hypothetical protein
MPGELGLCRVAMERAQLPPMTLDHRFHWDGVGSMARDRGPMTSSKQTFPSRHAALSLAQAPFETPCQMAMGGHARPSVTRGGL